MDATDDHHLEGDQPAMAMVDSEASNDGVFLLKNGAVRADHGQTDAPDSPTAGACKKKSRNTSSLRAFTGCVLLFLELEAAEEAPAGGMDGFADLSIVLSGTVQARWSSFFFFPNSIMAAGDIRMILYLHAEHRKRFDAVIVEAIQQFWYVCARRRSTLHARMHHDTCMLA